MQLPFLQLFWRLKEQHEPCSELAGSSTPMMSAPFFFYLLGFVSILRGNRMAALCLWWLASLFVLALFAVHASSVLHIAL